MTSALRLATGLLIACVELCACRSSPPTRFFTLDAEAPAEAPASHPAPSAPVRVDAVRIPAEFDRPELVRETAADRVTVYDQSRWSAPLAQIARRVLTQDLIARLPAGSLVFPEAPKPPGGRGLEVTILSVAHRDGGAEFDVSWSLSDAGGRRPAHFLRLDTPLTAPGPDGVAADLTRLLAKLSDAIALDVALES